MLCLPLLLLLDAVGSVVCRDLEARGVSAIPLIRRELRGKEIADGSSSTKFNYTACEAEFCDNFDWFAANWENKQQKLVHNFSSERCACCDELRPSLMTHWSLRTVDSKFVVRMPPSHF